jgi:hypothetical protein
MLIIDYKKRKEAQEIFTELNVRIEYYFLLIFGNVKFSISINLVSKVFH